MQDDNQYPRPHNGAFFMVLASRQNRVGGFVMARREQAVTYQ